MRVAALDLGSNTSLLLVADVADDGELSVVRDEATVTRMGQGAFETGRLHPAALARVGEALDRYGAAARELGCKRVFAVATSAARDAANADDLLALGRARGIAIHVIAGAREAALTYRGATGGLPPLSDPTVIDVGGGSTEIISATADGPRGVSVDVGAVRASERFVTTDPMTGAERDALSRFAERGFADLAPAAGDVVAVAGTPTTLAALDQAQPFAVERVHGYRLTRARVAHWADRLCALPLAARAALPGMPDRRADVMPAGALILRAAADRLGADELIVSTRGVRFGAAAAWREFAP